ncbi:MAG TPA: LPXTG cell wall anchor domain-containing protein [Edaphobacter sp.]
MGVVLSSQKLIFRAALCTFACAVLTAGVRAQDVSETTTQRGPATFDTDIRSGTVVYVSGNEMVVRGDKDGSLHHFVVPASQKFHVGGKEVTIHDLKPGTHLTEHVTTKTTPTTIKTVRTIEGRVWHVNAPSTVILTLPDGTNQQYNVPSGQKFMINGREQTVFQLRRGMNVSATVVTEEPVTEVSRTQRVTGVAPPPPPMPENVTVLLVQAPTPPTPAPAETAAAEPAPKALPKTGSEWPLMGLLGLVSLGAGMLTRRLRLAWK